VLEPGVLGEDYMYNRKKVGVCTLCKVDTVCVNYLELYMNVCACINYVV